MASILDRYGIKEVADVTFYEIDKDTGDQGAPVLYLDTLKVSTIEQTAETADARGGKGNPKLISWDYGKEINVTIEDALFSSKSMAIMFGNGTVSNDPNTDITRTVTVRLDKDGKLPDFFTADVYDSEKKGAIRKKVYMVGSGSDGVTYKASQLNIVSLTDEVGMTVEFPNQYPPTGTTDTNSDVKKWEEYNKKDNAYDKTKAGQRVFVTYTVPANAKTIVISGDSFPGTYYITGDTYARSDVTGTDQFFQFIIPKAKVTSENTITLEAEGDPSVFSMNLTVLRPESGEMMKLVQYDLTGAAG